jgi:sec-independent protein translocase protein TatC
MANDTSKEMPFLDHLEELRWRIIWSLLALVVAVVTSFVLMLKVDIIGLLQGPIAPYLHGRKLVFTHPSDPFSIVLSASVVMGVIIALPVILYQLWGFVSPALYRNEKRVLIPLFAFATLLFLCGVAMAYFVALPLSIGWLMGLQSEALEPMITAADYFSFATNLALAFGLCFELPIVILGLAVMGIVTPAFLNKYRRHAIVVCVVLAALLTPGDLVWTTIALAVPLYLLFEVSVGLTYVVDRRRQRRAARLAAEEAADAAAEAAASGNEVTA